MADLERIVANFAPEKHEPPLVAGHPKDDAPALGWVSELRRSGEYLEAKFSQVMDQVKDWVRGGRFKKVSISLMPDLTLRHVGILGAAIPAVKGLGSITFTAEDIEFIEFADIEHSEEDMERIDQLEEKVRTLQDQVKALQKAVNSLEAKAKLEPSEFGSSDITLHGAIPLTHKV